MMMILLLCCWLDVFCASSSALPVMLTAANSQPLATATRAAAAAMKVALQPSVQLLTIAHLHHNQQVEIIAAYLPASKFQTSAPPAAALLPPPRLAEQLASL
jgi:hypothetical protein